jgi:hypothetical protein
MCPAAAPDGVAGEALRAVSGYDSAVLATRDDDGAPVLRRVRVTGARDGALELEVPEPAELRAGPASVLCHSHDERLWDLRSVVVVGEYTGDGALRPDRLVGQAATPPAVVRSVRELRGTAHGHLERGGLPRPRVRWDELAAVKRAAVGGRRDQRRSSSSRL